MVSDPNSTHQRHLSNFQTEDAIFSMEGKKKKTNIILFYPYKDIYHILQKIFSLHIVEDEATIRHHIFGTFLDQLSSKKSNHQTPLNIRYKRFRFYSCIRSHKSYSIVKEKQLINT